MPIHPRKHSDDARIVADILKDAAEPRQATSVKKYLEKGTLPLPPRANAWWEHGKIQPLPSDTDANLASSCCRPSFIDHAHGLPPSIGVVVRPCIKFRNLITIAQPEAGP